MVIITTRTPLSTLPFVFFKMFPWSKQWPSPASGLQQIHGVSIYNVMPKVPCEQENQWQNHSSLDPCWPSIQEDTRCRPQQQDCDGANNHPVG